MARKEQDYDEILKGLQGIRVTLANLSGNAKKLKTEAVAAESELKDKVGKKDIQIIKDLSEMIMNIVNPGEEIILELEKKKKIEKTRFEQLER